MNVMAMRVFVLLVAVWSVGCARHVRESPGALDRVAVMSSASEQPDLSKGAYKRHADRHLAPIYTEVPFEVYCSCDVNFETGQIDTADCGYAPQTPGSMHNTLMHWEHVFPKSWAAFAMGCPDSETCKSNPQTSKAYHLAENDLYNLVPSVGSLNMKRSNNWLWEVRGEVRAFGECDFEAAKVDDEWLIEPPNRHKGNVARIILYFVEQHAIDLDDEAMALYLQWHAQDPVDRAERKRAKAIEAVMGHPNPWVTGDH